MIKQRSGDRRYGVVWRYFEMDPSDCTKACCKICKKTLVRGNSPRSFSTTPLIHHLKKHPDLFAEYQRLQQELTLKCDNSKEKRSHARVSWAAHAPQDVPVTTLAPPAAPTEPLMLIKFAKRQCRLAGTSALPKNWPRDHPSSVSLDNLLANMIVVDNKPVDVVKQPGLVSVLRHLAPQYSIPPRKFFATAKVPELFASTMSYVASILNGVDASHLSVLMYQPSAATTDATSRRLVYFLASWIDAGWSRRTAVLHCTDAAELDTAGVGGAVAFALAHWDIDDSRVHAVVQVGGETAEQKDVAGTETLRHPSCIIEALISEIVENQANVRSLAQKCLRLRQHFEGSLQAMHALHGLQQALGAPLHRMSSAGKLHVRDNVYDLFARIAEQRVVIAEYVRAQDARDERADAADLNLTEPEWVLLEQLLVLLGPFREASKMMRKPSAHIGSVIPAVTLLKRCFEKLENSDAGRLLKSELASIMNELKAAIRSGTRLANFEGESFFAVACLLDPRFKQDYFTRPSCVSKTKIFVVSEAVRLAVQARHSQTEPSEDRTSVAEMNGDTDVESCASNTHAASAEQPSPSTNSSASRVRSCGVCPPTVSRNQPATPVSDEQSGSEKKTMLNNEEANDDTASERLWRDAELELEAYLAEPISNTFDDDITNWWRTTANRFPLLANVGRKYLSTSLYVALQDFDGANRQFADLFLTDEQLLLLRANQFIAMIE